jgi:hypothetical protein
MPRRTFTRLARVWLVWQLSATPMAPLALWLTSHVVEQECQCPSGADAMCPMHKTNQGSSACALRSASGDGASVLFSLLYSVVVPPPTTSCTDSALVVTAIEPFTRAPIDRSLVPSFQVDVENVGNNLYLAAQESEFTPGQFSIPRLVSVTAKVRF